MTLRSTMSLAVVLLAGSVRADELKSGPQVGDGIRGAFPVQCANGLRAGKKACPV